MATDFYGQSSLPSTGACLFPAHHGRCQLLSKFPAFLLCPMPSLPTPTMLLRPYEPFWQPEYSNSPHPHCLDITGMSSLPGLQLLDWFIVPTSSHCASLPHSELRCPSLQIFAHTFWLRSTPYNTPLLFHSSAILPHWLKCFLGGLPQLSRRCCYELPGQRFLPCHTCHFLPSIRVPGIHASCPLLHVNTFKAGIMP